MKRIPLLLLFLMLAGCAAANPDQPVTNDPDAGSPIPNPYAPQPGDEVMQPSEVFLDSIDLLTLESYPLQFVLVIKGSLPTPCHQLRLVTSPLDDSGRISLDAYSLVDPGAVCIAVLQPFEARLPLGSFAPGHYQIVINGSVMAEFDAY